MRSCWMLLLRAGKQQNSSSLVVAMDETRGCVRDVIRFGDATNTALSFQRLIFVFIVFFVPNLIMYKTKIKLTLSSNKVKSQMLQAVLF